MTDLLRKTAIYAVLIAIVYLVFFFFLDRPVDLWINAHWSDTWVHTWGNYISSLATGSYIMLGLALCFLVVFICDSVMKVRWTRLLLYICLSGAITIVVGEGLKFLLGRYRPVMLFEQGLYGLHFLSAQWELNSTPSGHTFRAFSLLTAQSMLYRRFTAVFMSIAVLIGLSRIAVTAHYPGDVIFGAFIGIFTALWVYKYSRGIRG
ncbi:MAG: phosphatase PAP2 family protein [Dehalococcoidia bacterium]